MFLLVFFVCLFRSALSFSVQYSYYLKGSFQSTVKPNKKEKVGQYKMTQFRTTNNEVMNVTHVILIIINVILINSIADNQYSVPGPVFA